MNDTNICIDSTLASSKLDDELQCIDGMNRIEAEIYQNIRWWLDGVFHIAICAVGFVTNLISIRVLLSREMKNLFNIT